MKYEVGIFGISQYDKYEEFIFHLKYILLKFPTIVFTLFYKNNKICIRAFIQ
jgi:hypothetical protein